MAMVKTVTPEWTERMDAVLDELDLRWLSDNHPEVAEIVEFAIGEGAGPQEVRRQVMRRTQRYELALRCEHAAAALARMSNG